MRNIMIMLAAAGVAACGQSPDNAAANNGQANMSASQPPKRAAYCFFKDSETKDWTAKADKDGNVVVSGKAYRQDSRYKALLSPATVSGSTAEVAPTITQNDTGFAAPDDWWAVTETIPASAAVTTVTVTCGDRTLATLSVPRTK